MAFRTHPYTGVEVFVVDGDSVMLSAVTGAFHSKFYHAIMDFLRVGLSLDELFFRTYIQIAYH